MAYLPKLSSRLTAALVIGLALLCLTKLEPPKMARLDFLSDALWAGCRAQAVNRITGMLQ